MIKKMCLALQSALFMLSAVILFSCQSDYSTTPDKKITVTGTVRTYLQNNVPNFTVKIGDKSATTNSEGKFVISDVTTPYDIYFSDSSVSGSTINRIGFIYKNLALENPLIEYGYPNAATGIIKVHFSDGIASNKRAATFFTNGSNFNAHGMSFYSDSVSIMNAFLPDDKPVTGRLIALLYTVNSSHEIVSYDNFGFKDDIIISPGGENDFIFTPADLIYNPPEADISGNISGNIPPNTSLQLVHLYLSFSGRATVSYFQQTALQIFENPTFSLKIPAQLPIPYYPVIGSYIYDQYYNEVANNNFLLPYTSQTGLQLNLLQQAELLSPPDNSTNFNPKNTLQWSHPQNGKVFNLYITNISGNETTFYCVCTSDLNFTLNDISKFNFHSLYGKTFSWHVKTIGGYNSMNDYLNPDYKNILRSSMQMRSGRTFTTQVSN